jgi:glyceraldehyde-3-phosphate dehydrogenase type I
MAYRIAINGYGRIGRNILRVIHEYGLNDVLDVVAINDVAGMEAMAYLTRNDSIYGRFPVSVDLDRHELRVRGRGIRLFAEAETEKLPWSSLDVDLVLECTGLCRTRRQALRHLESGAPRILLSYPGPADVDRTVVYGVNHEELSAGDVVVSNASCTSNCAVPVLKIMDGEFRLRAGAITTIHSAMNDQAVLDNYCQGDPRKMRSASGSIVPVETHLARGISRIMPNLEGLIEAISVRVPTSFVSAMDMSLMVEKETDSETVNEILARAASGRFSEIMGFDREPLVSCDYLRDTRSCVVDSTQTRVSGNGMVKLFCWFDNEWAFSLRMCATALAMLRYGFAEQGGRKVSDQAAL